MRSKNEERSTSLGLYLHKLKHCKTFLCIILKQYLYLKQTLILTLFLITICHSNNLLNSLNNRKSKSIEAKEITFKLN